MRLLLSFPILPYIDHLHGKIPHHSVEEITGVPISVMEEMLGLMKKCNFGTISVGVGLSSSLEKYRNTEIAMNLVKELNNYSKFTIGIIRNQCNAEGFNQVASYMSAVTQKQWDKIMGNNPSHFKGEDHPVEMISWKDVQEFITKLNEKEGTDKYRLPSEAEWEYACRAGTQTRCFFGEDTSKLNDYVWHGFYKGVFIKAMYNN